VATDGAIRFSKMHGLGNDFVVIDAVTQSFLPTPPLVRRIADRHTGIGFDQLLLVEPATRADADFRYRIFNADGSEAEQCGNGARCFVQFVRTHGLTDRTELTLETSTGLLHATVTDGNLVSVEMAVPDFDPASLPYTGPEADAASPAHELEVNGERVRMYLVSMGNPHAVIQVDNVETAPVTTLGRAVGSHPAFPKGVNVGFLEIQDRRNVRLRVYERGAGETLACGSGACAAVAAGRRAGLLDERVLVELPGGRLVIEWSGPGCHVRMTGPATHVFEGSFIP
jgi:diaminopimelate epimerase